MITYVSLRFNLGDTFSVAKFFSLSELSKFFSVHASVLNTP